MRCPHCGGNLYRDYDDPDEACCLQCARRWPMAVKIDDGWLLMRNALAPTFPEVEVLT